MTPGLVRFRKHHRPCGQPAVEGGVEFLRPLPAQAGHFKRINAMPSDLPLMSTGRAMYPVPPQRGQSFGSTDPPQLPKSFSPIRRGVATNLILLRNTNTRGSAPATSSGFSMPRYERHEYCHQENMWRRYLIEAPNRNRAPVRNGYEVRSSGKTSFPKAAVESAYGPVRLESPKAVLS